MRPVRPRHGTASVAARSVTLGDSAGWPTPSGMADQDVCGGGSDRLSWPVSITVIGGLSGALWIGIAWLAHSALG